VKLRQVTLLIILILLADQALKFYIKTNYHMNEEHNMVGNWAKLHFIENKGMAWGWEFGGDFGKIFLTLFRLFAVFFGVYYLRKITKEKQHRGFIICVGLIFAGAVGNLIDSMFYGLIFTESPERGTMIAEGSSAIAKFVSPGNGYGTFLHGKVVDMFYFPIFDATWPKWMPFVGGEKFEFFSPVFNLADASISAGVITILVFQNRFFHKKPEKANTTVETNTQVNDSVQVS
jgi:signal peptidase II